MPQVFPRAARAASVLALAASLLACLWDHDTLKMERQRFPSALELITGKFLRHTREFYEWRVKDRLKKLEKDPDNVALLDDLAVAYDKTGRGDKAIEAMERKEKVKPGAYETYANLGTFHLHSGDFEKGIAFIDKAIAIDPDAHFGREVHQLRLAEYLSGKRRDGKIPLPVQGAGEPSFRGGGGFAAFVQEKAFPGQPGSSNREDSLAVRQKAVKGVLGMMKFGKHDSPVLLEALGDLLSDGMTDDAKMLASRAYLKAADAAGDPEAKAAFRALAKNALNMQTGGRFSQTQIPLDAVVSEFKKELAEAEAWYAKVRENELRWIREGKDPEAEFDRLYYAEPAVAHRLDLLSGGGAAAAVAAGLFLLLVLVRIARRGRATSPAA